MSALQELYRTMCGESAIGTPSFLSDPYFAAGIRIGAGAPDPLAGAEIDADGGIEGINQNGNQGDIGRWDGGGSFSKIDYQFRYDASDLYIDSGSDPFNMWLPASASLDFFAISIAGVFEVNQAGTLRMRDAASPFTEIDTASLTFTVVREL